LAERAGRTARAKLTPLQTAPLHLVLHGSLLPLEARGFVSQVLTVVNRAGFFGGSNS
jgi:hypothetical protein